MTAFHLPNWTDLYYSLDVGRNLWICDIHGSACAIYGSILCAEIHGLRRYLWIAQGSCLRGPREIFAGPPVILSHTCLLCNFSCNISGHFALYVWSTIPHVSVRCEAEVRNNSNITAGTCLERLPWRRSDADGLWFCSVDCRGPLKCLKLFNFRLVEITNPSIYVYANNIVSYAKFMDRVARSTDICAIHGFLRRVWIHRLRKQIHGYRRSIDCAQHRDYVSTSLAQDSVFAIVFGVVLRL